MKSSQLNTFLNRLKQKKILVLTHFYSTGGQTTDLAEWLRNKAGELVFIAHPFSYAKDTRSWLEHYKSGKLVEKRYFEGFLGRTDIGYWLKDVRLSRAWIKEFGPFDLAVVADPLNMWAVRPLRRSSIIKKLVFYVIDYVPQRFKNPLLNSIYHWFDRKAVEGADQTWNLTDRMQQARTKRGIPKGSQRTIPAGLFLHPHPEPKSRELAIAFMGHMRPGQGVEALVEAFPTVKKEVPKAKLVLLGGGPLEEVLRKRVKALGIQSSVEITGFVDDHKDLERKLRQCALAVAPYDGKTDFTFYADPGKPKVYLAAGLPVVITRIPAVADVIEHSGAGIAIAPSTPLAPVLIKLLKNPRTLAGMQQRAKTLAQTFNWDVVFPQALEELVVSD